MNPTHLRRRSVTTSLGRLSFLASDDAHGETVLFLHGVPGSAAAWAPVLERLSGGHATLLAPDLLGFGESDAPTDIDRLGVEAQASALLEFLDRLGVTAADVVTHDLGGPVALRLFEKRPELFRSLVLSSTNAFPDTPVPFPLSTIFWPLVGRFAATALFSAPMLRMLLRIGSGSPAVAVEADVFVGGRRQARTCRILFEHSLRNLRAVYAPLEAVLPRLSVPTAVLWGDHDPFFPPAHGRRTAEAITGSTFTALPGAGHFLPAERPEAYVAALASLRARRQRTS